LIQRGLEGRGPIFVRGVNFEKNNPWGPAPPFFPVYPRFKKRGDIVRAPARQFFFGGVLGGHFGKKKTGGGNPWNVFHYFE